MESLVYIILIVIFIINLCIFDKYNKLIKLQNKIKKSQASIDIYSNKRFDLIPNLVECIKSYSKYESNTIESIISLRSNYQQQKNMNIKDVEKMNNELNKYLAIVEAYPDLKANTQYMSLHSELKEIEDELERARHQYNDNVTDYNTLIESVPTNIIASIFAFKKAELFHVDSVKKENVKVEL